MKRGNPELRKRQFINVIKNTIDDCLYIFGYTKAPYIFETSFDNNALMSFVEGKMRGTSAIYYDYQKFQKVFSDCDDDDRILRLTHIVAHEMRHYYQFRQIKATKPRENPRIIQEWKNEKVIRNRGKDNEYYGNVRELDANTFAYIYTAERFDSLLCNTGIPQNYRVRMKNYAKRLYGSSHPVFGVKFSEYFS